MKTETEVKFTARVPAELTKWLAQRAIRNDRSANRELVALLRSAMKAEAKELAHG